MTTTFNAAATKTVRVNGTNFVYREIGNKSGIPVVFLHHLTAVLEDWDPAIADGLAKGRPVIIFDNRGALAVPKARRPTLLRIWPRTLWPSSTPWG